jgi:hypothetical protein
MLTIFFNEVKDSHPSTRNASSFRNGGIGIQTIDYEANMEKEVLYVVGAKEGLDIDTIGGLEFPKSSMEWQRCKAIQRMLEEYGERVDDSKPLSIAVFGPPGSGKSRFVKQIAASVGGKYAKPNVFNLSQLSESDKLVKQLQDVTDDFKPRSDNLIPIFFFDEFDSSLGEVSLGWLRWFLAPMQDGELLSEGKLHKFGKAVFMFAGGTAASFSEFEERAGLDQIASREKKVPDFISRLRGFIDIQDVNSQDADRKARRALLLRFFLDGRWSKGRNPSGLLPIDEQDVESLLSNVHFIHGVRSMEALVNMSTLDGTQIKIPNNELTKIHVSRGALDRLWG